jgi:hypothetical protein
VLTEVKAYSAWKAAPTLLLNDNGRPETDLIQIRNIDGLDPVKASVSTSPFGSIDGESYTGSNVPKRNIVLTLHPNPDWDNWSPAALRRVLYSYFMPKQAIRLVFYSDDMAPVEISGIVESAEANPFSQDPEMVVSIICPDPYFTAVDPVVFTGSTVRSGGATTTITYNGSIAAGVHVKVAYVSGSTPNLISVQIGDPGVNSFRVNASVSNPVYFELSSVPRQKFVQTVDIGTGVITNLLYEVEIGSNWPSLEYGDNEFSVITDLGVQDWELSYYERFGGL